MGRPERPIDWAICQELAELGATTNEMAGWFMLSVDRFKRKANVHARSQGFNSYDAWKSACIGRADLKARMAMFEEIQHGEKRNPIVLQYMKSRLGFGDKVKVVFDGPIKLRLDNWVDDNPLEPDEPDELPDEPGSNP